MAPGAAAGWEREGNSSSPGLLLVCSKLKRGLICSAVLQWFIFSAQYFPSTRMMEIIEFFSLIVT